MESEKISSILGIDSSGSSASIALENKNRIVGSLEIDSGLVHSVKLLPAISSLLELLDFDSKDLDLAAVVSGPGSFTGIRIGISTANAFALANNIKAVGVNTLDALAMNGRFFNKKIISTVEAQKEGYYISIYEGKNGELERLTDYEIKRPEEIIEYISKANEEFIILGDMTEDDIDEEIPENAVFSDSEMNIIHAKNVISLAKKIYLEGEYSRFAEAFYMRKSHAEAEYDKKHGI